MTPEEYIEWIESLETQVLTDELKETMIDNIQNLMI